MKITFDIDLDFGNRDAALECIKHIPASIIKDGRVTKHNSGVYVTDVPINPFTGTAAFDYKVAEDRGYFKLDFLNVFVYQQVKSEEHLIQLMTTEPNWDKLLDKEFFDKVIHINGHYNEMKKMPEPINSIERLAMFLALIRPGKKHLVGKTWKEVAKEIWIKTDDSYSFKKSHSVGYAHLVVVHMNFLTASLLE